MVDNKEEAVEPFDFANHTFVTPTKTLVTVPHVAMFQQSNCCKELLGFVAACQAAVKASKMTETPLTDVSTPALSCRGSGQSLSISSY